MRGKPGAVTAEVDVDGNDWLTMAQGLVQLGSLVWAVTSARFRSPAVSYTAALRELRQRPGGGEVGGTLPGGATWYVRIPPSGQEGSA